MALVDSACYARSRVVRALVAVPKLAGLPAAIQASSPVSVAGSSSFIRVTWRAAVVGYTEEKGTVPINMTFPNTR